MSALSDFRTRVEEVESLLDRIAPGWSPERQSVPTTFSANVPVGALSRSALVLLVSYFEGFLKDLADAAFDVLIDRKVPCDKLSTTLRGHAVLTHVRQLRSANDPDKIWNAVRSLGEIGLALNSPASITEAILAREATKRELTSIDPTRINALLRVLGDTEFRDGPVSRHAQRLNGLKQVRDNAVHGNEQDLPALGFADVFNAAQLLQSCAADLDQRIRSLLERILVGDATGDFDWT